MTSVSEKPKHADIIPLRSADNAQLERISREGLLSLTLDEMKAIQAHFQLLKRDPTDVELETIAQTWSEHCYHKTFKARYQYEEKALAGEPALGSRLYDNLLKETVAKATTDLNPAWCLSVFKDNAGVIAFDDEDAVCFKVETHNHPSALEPYGGAGTGIGGVIRDVMGCGLGGKPVLNTDVFCFGMPDTPAKALPEGMLAPKRIARGVISGVRDYGNRMGIPTANGAIYFDPGYTGNPLVFAGTVGVIPNRFISKSVQPGDLVVAVGGRTGRDGIHGATFSSAPLEKGISSSVVQIGHAIMEKKTLDVLLNARNKGLYRAVTDCGAGGFSSAVGELGSETGVRVRLEAAPLKYPGLKPWEIWLSESQERMALVVPADRWPSLRLLFAQEDVEAVVIGEFTDDKKLTVTYDGEVIGELDMDFLHNGTPRPRLTAAWDANEHRAKHLHGFEIASGAASARPLDRSDLGGTLEAILAHPIVASKESVVRQYDHEVQGGSVVKPFMGPDQDGPSDACVFRPKLDKWKAVGVSNGLAPELGKRDPYLMAHVAIDEAYRNLIAVGGGLKYAAILDNFCWGDTKNPLDLAALVRAAEGCREAATQYGLPFISGKDSFNNTWKSQDGKLHSIPPTLLVSAIGVLDDARFCVTSNLKGAGNLLYLVGDTLPDMQGSLAGRLWNAPEAELKGLPTVNFTQAKALYKKLQTAMSHRLIKACHDLSEGGLAVAAAEMAMGGNLGAEITLPEGAGLDAATILFSETPSRFLVEVAPDRRAEFEQTMGALMVRPVGVVAKKPSLVVRSAAGVVYQQSLERLKTIWKGALSAL